jgi:hypothetical protein
MLQSLGNICGNTSNNGLFGGLYGFVEFGCFISKNASFFQFPLFRPFIQHFNLLVQAISGNPFHPSPE